MRHVSLISLQEVHVAIYLLVLGTDAISVLKEEAADVVVGILEGEAKRLDDRSVIYKHN